MHDVKYIGAICRYANIKRHEHQIRLLLQNIAVMHIVDTTTTFFNKKKERNKTSFGLEFHSHMHETSVSSLLFSKFQRSSRMSTVHLR